MFELLNWQPPFEQQTIDAVVRHSRIANAMPTGTGKTYIIASAIKKLGLRPLVIVPKAGISTWRTVCAGFELEPYDVLNWERLKSGGSKWYDGRWHIPGDALLVADEVHRGASGYGSAIGRALSETKSYSVPTIMVSATLASSPLQMRHTGYLLDLHKWNPGAYYDWCSQHGCWYDRQRGYWRYTKGRKGREIMANLRRSLGSRWIYESIANIPGFPACTIEARLYDIEKKYREQIDAAWSEMSDNLKKPGVTEMSERVKARRRIEYLKIPLLLDLVEEALEQDMSPVIFFSFTEPFEQFVRELKHREITNVSLVYGGQDRVGTANRDREVQLFQENINHVAVIKLQAGGLSLSLHDLKHERPRIAYIQISDSASDVRQAVGRVWRAGGTPCIQIIVLAEGTVETQVHRNLSGKLDNLDALNDGDMRV